MSRVLFVDDEKSVTDGLRRTLREFRNEWDMVFVNSGEEALDAAAEQPLDVIVTDMRMPGMDGSELLRRMNRESPKTVRIVLSGHSELEAVMRTVPIAHQFLSKPCEAKVLKDVVTRALELQALLSGQEVQHLVGELKALPAQPETFRAIQEALADPDVDVGDVAAIVEADIALAAKILQVVNSSFFGLPTSLTDTRQAVSYLGLNVIRDLVLATEVFEVADAADGEVEAFLGRLQDRSQRTGRLAQRILESTDSTGSGSNAFTAGMLHDIGLLVLATQSSDRQAAAADDSPSRGAPLDVADMEASGAKHAEIGAYLLGVWGLPYAIVEAAAYHHRPEDLPHEGVSELTAVHVAAALVEDPAGSTGLDLDYLERLDLADRLPEWTAWADPAEPDDTE